MIRVQPLRRHTASGGRSAGAQKGVFEESRRVLKPCGRVAIIEGRKEEMPLGPFLSMRLSPQEVEDAVRRYGFETIAVVHLEYNYMLQFKVAPGPGKARY